MTNLDSILKSRGITLPTKACPVKAMVFSIVMYGCESWTIKKAEHRLIEAFELWCWRRLWESLGLQEIQPVLSKGNQSWLFIGRTDAEAETPMLRPPHVKNWLIEKTLMLGKIEDWMTEDEMVGWYHRLNGHEFEYTSGVADGHGSLACCSLWGHKQSDTTERLN